MSDRSDSNPVVGPVRALRNKVYGAVVGDVPEAEDADVSAQVRLDQPSNFLRHVGALAMTKTGDGLMDPKLVLSWLLGTLEASSTTIGLLVPVRESGALLPQLALSGRVRAARRKARVWAAGSLGQGACVLGLAAAAWTLDGSVAGWAVVGLLACFALFRAVCSVSYKPLLGRTLVRSTRGTATGTANSIAAVTVFAFGALLAIGWIPLGVRPIGVVLVVAAALWWSAAALALGLREDSGERPAADEGDGGLLSQLRVLRDDSRFARFVLVRALLVGTALAPPYLVTADTGGGTLGALGPFVVASALASALSSYVWGRLADRSSRLVLVWAGATAAFPLGTAAILGVVVPSSLALPFVLPALLFALMVSYQGVRLGRSTHLVDMASDDQRATFTAVSNTVIGVVLVLGGVFGWLADAAGRPVVLGAFAALCMLAAWLGRGLEEVQIESQARHARDST